MMTRWARISDGKVVEIIDFDPEGRFVEELVKTFVKCPDEVTHGWGYDWVTGEFYEIPVVPPEEVDPEPTEIEVLQRENLMLQIALAETIEKQENDKVNSQIALAELVETLIIKGVL